MHSNRLIRRIEYLIVKAVELCYSEFNMGGTEKTLPHPVSSPSPSPNRSWQAAHISRVLFPTKPVAFHHSPLIHPLRKIAWKISYTSSKATSCLTLVANKNSVQSLDIPASALSYLAKSFPLDGPGLPAKHKTCFPSPQGLQITPQAPELETAAFSDKATLFAHNRLATTFNTEKK